MNFLYYDLQLTPDQAVEVTLDNKTKVRLLTEVMIARQEESHQEKNFSDE